jgi:hypothetical protein
MLVQGAVGELMAILGGEWIEVVVRDPLVDGATCGEGGGKRWPIVEGTRECASGGREGGRAQERFAGSVTGEGSHLRGLRWRCCICDGL